MEQQTEVRPGGDETALKRLALLLWVAIGTSLLALLAASTQGIVAAVGIGVLIFLASFGAGSFLGFLFGVPRVLGDDKAGKAKEVEAEGNKNRPAEPPKRTDDAIATEKQPTRLRLLSSNANLERISDWLTTMLVGAGLVELHNVNGALVGFRQFLYDSARVLPAADGSLSAGNLPTIGPIVLVFGTAAGFLFMYLNTRLVLVRLFQSVEVLISREEPLPPSEQRAIKAIAFQASEPGRAVDQKAASKKAVTVEDALNLMFDLLYKSDPDRVLDVAAELLTTDAVNRPDYWFYQAAAFGQKLHRLEKGTDDWVSMRDKAMDAARRAVGLHPSYRGRLWRISDPKSTDNDLAPLRRDPEFRRLVGRPLGGKDEEV
jgi:hypothetical protein